MDRVLLETAGRAAFGEEWQRALARSLGPHHPDGPRSTVDNRLVRRWAAGERPIPGWVWEALPAVLDAAARGAEVRAAELRRIAARIERDVPPRRVA